MVRKTIFGKDIDLDKTILFDSYGQRITDEYCENILKDMRKKELIN
jgi:flavorubredoxin